MGEGTEGLRNEEQLNRDIELTRMQLSQDVDELGYKVSPSHVMERRKQAVRGRFGSMKDKVMGSAQSAAGSVKGSAGSVQGTGSSLGQSVGDTATGAVQTIEQRTEGNPLAAGVIAFGAGMLLSSMFPASEKEQRLAQQGMDAAKEHGQPLMEEAKSMAGDVGGQLKETAKQGVDEVRSTAGDSAQTLKDEGQGSVQSVRETRS